MNQTQGSWVRSANANSVLCRPHPRKVNLSGCIRTHDHGADVLFFNPNHDYCVAETGYLADKADPSATDRDYFMLGS